MIFLVLFISVLLAVLVRSRSRKGYGMPPGPKGLPILGNIFQLPPLQFLRFTEWKEQFGPIFSLNLAGQPVIVINSLEAAVDLLERRSSIYSDRPRVIVANEILSGEFMLPLIPYGSLWKKFRKASHEGLRSQIVPVYQDAQALEAATLVQNLINRPELWAEEIIKSTASSMKTTIYGTSPLTSITDPVVAYISEMGHRLTTAVVPGAYFVEFSPKMMYLPTWLAPWKREAMEWHKENTQKLQDLVRLVKEQVDDGTDYKQSFVSKLYSARSRHGLNQKEEAWLTGSIFVAAFDTSSVTLRFFVLAMRLYPDVMKKAQAELDRVVGRGRVPNSSDRVKLPYICAMVKELLRWGVVAPLGLPHQAQQDDYYKGYFIPKGTLILVNAWGINHDPDIFPDPHEFRPERFLDPSETIDVVVPGTRNQGHVTFGFGRRFCIGMTLAVQFQFINIATLLWAANIEPACNNDGQIITPTNSPAGWVDEGVMVRPASFPVNIVPRFSGAEAVLRRARGH
ncbi:cytochrome P450 [Pluteus cervinus]|uniref:Cytochrome P450 n=1 Tax=Pluteus cervinus TaxID=181527 RepID=A0ACD3AP55_9AGAR|nr:cytochrome P450 [Pluteus cervinus]